MTTPYDRPSDPAKRHSAALTDGPDRAGARAMLKATGFTDEDLAKPIVGVGTTWIETMPCNLNQRDLAVHVKRGVRDAGGTPMEFNTIAVSDGVSMGTSGMRASLVSREVIADSIELVARGHLFDGLVQLVACDKTNPGGAMAVGRLDIPAVVSYTGSIAPGLYRQPRGVDRRRVRGDRCARRRQDQRRRPARARVGRVPRRGRLRRPVHREHDVDDPRLPRAVAVRGERDPGHAPRQGAGRVRVRAARRAARPRRRDAALDRHAGSRSRTRWRRSPRREARPTPCSTSSRSPAISGSSSRSTTSSGSPRGPRSSPT